MDFAYDLCLMRNLEIALKTNSLNEGSGLWQMKQELNTFFTGTEPASSFSSDRVMRGHVELWAGDGLQHAIPTDSHPKDLSAHYLYVWHPDMGGYVAADPEDPPNPPPTKFSYRTLLDKEGRFAVKLPTTWAYVFVRTEQSLWRKVGFVVRGPGGLTDESRVFLPWQDINAWQTLKLAYGDMDEDNVIENFYPEDHVGGWMNSAATDLNQYDARIDAVVRLITGSQEQSINYYHLGVDLNRNRRIEDDDYQILAKYPNGNIAGATP
ncbi:MAG: hypothetical protein JNJ45_09240 [Chthonomonas sp.]|nr:hypothetical protein [Chthonomonas sp.]